MQGHGRGPKLRWLVWPNQWPSVRQLQDHPGTLSDKIRFPYLIYHLTNRQKEQEAAALAQLESDAAQPGGDAAPTEIAADG